MRLFRTIVKTVFVQRLVHADAFLSDNRTLYSNVDWLPAKIYL